MDLSAHQHRIDHASAIMQDDVPQDSYSAGLGINFDDGHMYGLAPDRHRHVEVCDFVETRLTLCRQRVFRGGKLGAFRQRDLPVGPDHAASVAFPHDQKVERPYRKFEVNGRKEDYNDQLFRAGLASLAYLPATIAPIGITSSGLPVGVQIVGPYLRDRDTIEFARLLAQEIGGFRPPPGFD
jgi:Asp-tRNA(Asn)/Glu-tRNA(Gln) amidotransferase A subunit family amidase